MYVWRCGCAGQGGAVPRGWSAERGQASCLAFGGGATTKGGGKGDAWWERLREKGDNITHVKGVEARRPSKAARREGGEKRRAAREGGGQGRARARKQESRLAHEQRGGP